jgi:hypothetical protein
VSTPLALKGVTVDSEASPEVWSHSPIIAKLRLVNLNSTFRRRPAMADDVVDYSGTSDKDKVIRSESADSPPLRLWHSVVAGSQLQRDPECINCAWAPPPGGQGRSPVPVPDLSGTPPPPGRGTLRSLSPPRPSPIPIGGPAAPWSGQSSSAEAASAAPRQTRTSNRPSGCQGPLKEPEDAHLALKLPQWQARHWQLALPVTVVEDSSTEWPRARRAPLNE